MTFLRLMPLAIILCVALVLGAAAAQGPADRLPNFTKPFFGCDAVAGERHLLTILWDPHRPDHPAPAKEAVEKLLFGKERSLEGYLLENSYGRCRLVNAGILGWYDADKPGEHYWGPADEGDKDGDGWVNGHTEKWAEAVRKADPDFDYAAYDANHDGVLDPSELGVHIVIPQNNPFGTNRDAVGRQVPQPEPLVVDGVRIPVIAESYIGAPPDLSLVAHELCHLLLSAPDEYFGFYYPYAAGPFSLMDNNRYCSHLDPLMKLRLGWAKPRLVTTEGWYTLPAAERSPDVLVLCDSSRTASEYFVIENRWPEDSYEKILPDRGLAIWRIVDDMKALGSLPAPAGCDAEKWATIGGDDWGRKALALIRPVLKPRITDKETLWDGSDPATGYDLDSEDDDPAHAKLVWADGTPSGFYIRGIPPAGPEMTFYIGR
jgi:M6 family metalloprotease-like protein